MNWPHTTRMSLRTRMLWWQVAILTPLLVAAMLHHVYLMPRFIRPLQDIVKSVTAEILEVKNLQFRLQFAAMPVNDYLINGNQRELRQFASDRQRVELGFAAMHTAPFKAGQERDLIAGAWDKWLAAKKVANELFAISHPVGKISLHNKMRLFDGHIDDSTALLEQLYDIVYRRLETEQAVAHAAHREMQVITFGSFIISIIISTVIGSALIHSILRNLESVRRGAGHIAKGTWNQPVYAEGIHELEQLAETFNDMANKLQLHDAALEDLAIHDGLTGLENRRVFDVRLEEELQRTMRYHHPLSLLMLDIDHFKVVNDSHGHLVGDAVLRTVANTIKCMVRPADHVFRYGGEEFVVLAPETDATGALALAERIRETVAATAFPVSAATDAKLTISIGVTSFLAEGGRKEDLIVQADTALYAAKSAGRNRTHLYQPPEPDRRDATNIC